MQHLLIAENMGKIGRPASKLGLGELNCLGSWVCASMQQNKGWDTRFEGTLGHLVGCRGQVGVDVCRRDTG